MKRSVTAETARQREQAKGATAFDRLMAERTRAEASRRRRITKKQDRREHQALRVMIFVAFLLTLSPPFALLRSIAILSCNSLSRSATIAR
jgi:hypothetical protein